MVNGEFCNFIDDGYSEDGFLAAEKGLHGDVTFSYRPLLPEQRDGIDEVTLKQGAAQGAKVICSALAKNLVAWSIKDSKGQAVPIKPGAIGRLRPRLFDKLWAVVAGRMPSDVKPDASQAECGDYVTSLLEGPDAKREGDAKN